MSNDRQNLSEFGLITRFFSDISPPLTAQTSSVELGVGDDCALLNIAAGQQLALSIDTLVAGRHFPIDADSADIAHRALAVSISDLAAMGATPLAFTLAISLPEADFNWLRGFSHGLKEAAGRYRIPLIGGDTTRGPLAITLQVHGTVPAGNSLQRSGAGVGDSIYASGYLGDAAAALAVLNTSCEVGAEEQQYFLTRFYQPAARLSLGQRLLGIASAAIDISDGLLADLGHIVTASKVGATVYSRRLPISPVMTASVESRQALMYALTGGDDYELCFTVPPSKVAMVNTIAEQLNIPLTHIGEITEGDKITCLDHNNKAIDLNSAGYQHFR